MKVKTSAVAMVMGVLMFAAFVSPAFTWPSVYPKGTTIYKPDKCYNGYTLKFGGRKVNLIDMNGRVVHKWTIPAGETPEGVHRARLLKNGHIIVQRGKMMSTTGAIEEYDWDNKLVWQFIPQGKVPHRELLGPHHDVFRKPNGNTLLICREVVPDEYMKKVTVPWLKDVTVIYSDVILEVTPANEIVWQWHGYKYLDINQYRIFASLNWFAGPYNNTKCDWMHTNTVQALPENKWYDKGDKRFKPGNVMISCRSLDTIYIIDRDTKKIIWTYTGDYMGGMSGQHEPHMIEKGLPGEGNILIFDNGASPYKNLGHVGCSYVLEINPTTEELVWKYEDGRHFHSSFTSSSQRLKNGNTLICEQAGKRIFEVTEAGEIVWEHVNGSSRAYRYSYDHCSQTAALAKPKEVPVTAPKDFRVPGNVSIGNGERQ